MRFGGALRSENVGMSSDNLCENQRHRKSEVSYATLIGVGLVGPKGSRKVNSMDSWSKFQHRNYPVMQRKDAIRTVKHAYGHGVWGPVGK